MLSILSKCALYMQVLRNVLKWNLFVFSNQDEKTRAVTGNSAMQVGLSRKSGLLFLTTLFTDCTHNRIRSPRLAAFLSTVLSVREVDNINPHVKRIAYSRPSISSNILLQSCEHEHTKKRNAPHLCVSGGSVRENVSFGSIFCHRVYSDFFSFFFGGGEGDGLITSVPRSSGHNVCGHHFLIAFLVVINVVALVGAHFHCNYCAEILRDYLLCPNTHRVFT